MKKLLLFAAVLTLCGNWSVCYADTQEEEILDTVKVFKQNMQTADDIPVKVSLTNMEKDYCYYCPSENTWHIYTCGDKVVYQGGEIDSSGKAVNWCRIRQDKLNSVFVSQQLDDDFVKGTNGKPYDDRTLTVSASPKLSLLDDRKQPFSAMQFHCKAYKKDALQALNVTVYYKDSAGNAKEIIIDKDTILAAGSKIDSIKITKNEKDALAVKSIHCGTFNKDCKDFIHRKDFWTIPFSDMGVSKGAAINLEIDYLALNDKCMAVGGNPKKYNIAIDNHSGLVETFTSPLAKAIGVVIVLLLAIFCVRFCLKRPDRNRHESAPAQKTQKNGENHDAKTNPDEPDTETIVEKQRKTIEYLQGEQKRNEKEIENLNGQLQSARANLNGEKNQTANLQRAITAKNEELEKYKGRLSKVQSDCDLLRDDKDKLKVKLQSAESEYRKCTEELSASYERRIDELTMANEAQRKEYEKELKDKDAAHEKNIEFMRDSHRSEIEVLTADFNARNKMFADDARQRMTGGKTLLEQILDAVNGLSSSALSTSAYGQWIERMLDGGTSNSLPVFYEAFSINEQPFETYRHIRTLIESSISDVNSWINTLARLASYASSEAIASDMRKDGADTGLLSRTFELMKVFMALYGYECIVPKLFVSTVDDCSGEFVRDNTDLFINRVSGAAFREAKSGTVCDFSSVACVKLVEPSDENRLIKGKVNSL